jgi:hypothetical protein
MRTRKMTQAAKDSISKNKEKNNIKAMLIKDIIKKIDIIYYSAYDSHGMSTLKQNTTSKLRTLSINGLKQCYEYISQKDRQIGLHSMLLYALKHCEKEQKPIIL